LCKGFARNAINWPRFKALLAAPSPNFGRAFAVSLGYVIFFRYVGERFEVVNILEGRRDVESYFNGQDEP